MQSYIDCTMKTALGKFIVAVPRAPGPSKSSATLMQPLNSAILFATNNKYNFYKIPLKCWYLFLLTSSILCLQNTNLRVSWKKSRCACFSHSRNIILIILSHTKTWFRAHLKHTPINPNLRKREVFNHINQKMLMLYYVMLWCKFNKQFLKNRIWLHNTWPATLVIYISNFSCIDMKQTLWQRARFSVSSSFAGLHQINGQMGSSRNK